VDVVVETPSGAVRGSATEDGGAVFRGIPYAAAPFGPLRLRAPVCAGPWPGVLDATAFGPRPPQPVPPPEKPWSSADGLGCLTINLHTPDPRRTGLPVMVWIHGGAYLDGASDDPGFDGTLLTSAGVVLVTFNYRVGFEGFGYLPELPANRGLLDQVAALEWVRDNIAAFGGDPGNVTVFGESAGAGSVVALATMPRASGLVRRGIAQSVPALFPPPDLAKRVSEQVAAAAGVRPQAAELAALTPEALVAATQAVTAALAGDPDRWGALAYAFTPCFPVVDGEVLPTPPVEALAEGAAAEVDLLVGFNRDEYQFFLAAAGTLGSFGERDARRAAAAFGLPPSAVEAYRQAYPGLGWSDLYSLACSDWLFRMPSIRTADAHAAGSTSGHTYLQEFTWASSAAGGELAACHAIDVPFVFGTFDTLFARTWLGENPGPQARALSERMRAAWTAFAATGDPGWPSYQPDQALTKLWGATDALVPDPEAASRRIWHHVGQGLPHGC
jgi:para-nitrobenzyl esterase